MNFKEIQSKLVQGEQLTEEEQAFFKAFDLEKVANDASAKTRRKYEDEATKLKADIEELRKSITEKTAEAEEKEKSKMTAQELHAKEVADLKAMVAKIEKDKAEAEARAQATARSQAIRDKASEAGIKPADKVDSKLFYKMLEMSLTDVDVTNEEAITEELTKFKETNAGMISAGGVPTPPPQGTPHVYGVAGANPFERGTYNLTAQFELLKNNPAEAQRLANLAGVEIPGAKKESKGISLF